MLSIRYLCSLLWISCCTGFRPLVSNFRNGLQLCASTTVILPLRPTEETFPDDYDAIAHADWFNRRPLSVVGRIAQITYEASGLLLTTITRSKEKSTIAAAVRDSMIRLGPSTVKIGQALAARGDLIGAEGINQLQQLQDAIPWTFTTEQAKNIIREDLLPSGEIISTTQRARVEQLLSSLSETPIAAASIGQVYRAHLPATATEEATDVAVKIQRPALRETAAADFYLARILASMLTGVGLLRSVGVGAVDEYATRLFEEMDYRNEAKNLELFGTLYGGELVVSCVTDSILSHTCLYILSHTLKYTPIHIQHRTQGWEKIAIVVVPVFEMTIVV